MGVFGVSEVPVYRAGWGGMRVLVTGARGYIGAHVVRTLGMAGCAVVGSDRPGAEGNDVGDFVDGFFDWDVRLPLPTSAERMVAGVEVVVHLAALISVEESVALPTDYYETNWLGTVNVLRHFPKVKFVFSSTGTAFDAQSPYSRSKVAAEESVRECSGGYTIFRFYNVAGSEGFRSFNEPTHLMRRAAMAARGEIPFVSIYGTDYETRDGTCVRDYVHVQDVADAVARACRAAPAMSCYECLGSGKGYTVREVVRAMQKVSGVEFAVREEGRRRGDAPVWAVPCLSGLISPRHSLEEMCHGALRFL